jgi:hypothetical protein
MRGFVAPAERRRYSVERGFYPVGESVLSSNFSGKIFSGNATFFRCAQEEFFLDFRRAHS